MEQTYCGDALEVLRSLKADSIHTCVTSPPYYNLRDYGTPGQIGMEETPEEYAGKLVEVFREVRRVLRPDGTLWVNIGDSYATRSGAQPPTNTRNKLGHTEKHPPGGYKYKDLIGGALAAGLCPPRRWVVFAPGYCVEQIQLYAGERPGPLHQEPRIYFPAVQVPQILL